MTAMTYFTEPQGWRKTVIAQEIRDDERLAGLTDLHSEATWKLTLFQKHKSASIPFMYLEL